MLKLFNVNFNNMPEKKLDEIFSLRKITFKDRLDWKVTCIDGKESDQYDDENTNYILGTIDNTIVCSVRFIEMKYPTMITALFLLISLMLTYLLMGLLNPVVFL